MSGDINKAQAILKKQHSEIGGLFCCTIGGSLEFPRAQGDQWLQIIHDGSDHWVVAKRVYSAWICTGFWQQSRPSMEKQACPKLYVQSPPITWKGNDIDNQRLSTAEQLVWLRGIHDWFCFELRIWRRPCKKKEWHKKVTPSPCSVNGFCKLTPFPSFPSRATKTHETVEAEFLYCPCRRKGLEKKGLEFIGFDAYGCNKWFHKMCFNNCPKDMQDKWFCINCQ